MKLAALLAIVDRYRCKIVPDAEAENGMRLVGGGKLTIPHRDRLIASLKAHADELRDHLGIEKPTDTTTRDDDRLKLYYCDRCSAHYLRSDDYYWPILEPKGHGCDD